MRSSPPRALVGLLTVVALVAVPISVMASHTFNDVPDSNVFHDDIAWLADADVTRGCNPPANTEYCPSDNVTREQMAAFMHRLADNQVVDAGWLNGMTADEIIAAAAAASGGGDDDGDTADSGPFAKLGPDGDIYNYLVEMNKGDGPVVLAEIGPFTFAASCEDNAGNTVGTVKYSSSEDWYEFAEPFSAGTVRDVISFETPANDPVYDFWLEELAAPGSGVYIADDGYKNTMFLEHGDIDCVFAGTFFPHFRDSEQSDL